MGSTYHAVILDAGLRQSLVSVRSLGRRGLSVALVDTLSDVPAFWSRWSRARLVCPAELGGDAFVDRIRQLLEGSSVRVLIASHDGTVAALRRHRAGLERYVRLALADESAMTIAVNKELTLGVARQIGLRVPRSVTLETESDLPDALREVGLPAVVKPTESWLYSGQNGVRIGPELVTTSEEARRAVAAIAGRGGVSLFQTLLTGRREAVSLLYAKSEIYARFAQWAKRMNPPLGGESVLRQSIAVPSDIGSQAERLVREMNLEGYAEVEFRRDAAGLPYLMEVNPRLSASVEIAVRSGVDFPHLLYQWANGDPIDRVTSYRAGRWMRYFQGDVATTMAAVKGGGRPGVLPPLQAVLGFGVSCLRPMQYDYLDWRDPLPAIRAMSEFTSSLARTIRRHAAV